MRLHKPKTHSSKNCPLRDVLDRLTDRWSLIILLEINTEVKRFTQLRQAIDDISQRMLSQTLRRLEEDGLLARTVHASSPPRVDYCLTMLGRSFLKPVTQMAAWAAKNHSEIRTARHNFVKQKTKHG